MENTYFHCNESLVRVHAPFACAVTVTCRSTLPTVIAVLGVHQLHRVTLDPTIKLENCGLRVLALV